MPLANTVVFHDSTAYDFLAALFRLHNKNQRVGNLAEELMVKERFKLNEDIKNWIEETEPKLSGALRESLDIFFNAETFFGMCLTYRIPAYDLKTSEDFIRHIEGLDSRSLLWDFIQTGYSDALYADEASFRANVLADEKEAVKFINTHVQIPSRQKWELLQFFMNPDTMKEKLLELFRWFNANVYSGIVQQVETITRHSIQEIRKKLDKYGDEYLKLFTQTEYGKLKQDHKIVIAVSYFYEIAILVSAKNHLNLDLYMVGFMYDELIIAANHTLLSNLRMFKALADETRLNILKLLCRRPWYGHELAQELKLSNSTVSYHISMLTLSGFISVNRVENRTYYSADIEAVKQVINVALDKMQD